MFRQVVALLLINTYYSSLGNPIEPSASKNLISNSLTTLANHCANEFVSKHIKSRVDDCAVVAPPYSEKEFECLIFYDINTQLCVASPTLTLTPDDTNKINAEQNVNSLCNSAKDWVFTDLPDYEKYKNIALKVFMNPLTCGKICGVEDVVSEDAKFYCRYYKWGSEVLQNHAIATQKNNDGNVVETPTHPATVDKTANKPPTQAPNAIETNKSIASDPPKENPQTSAQSTPVETSKIEGKAETSSLKLNSSPSAVSEPQKSDEIDVDIKKASNHDADSGKLESSHEKKTSAATTQDKASSKKDASAETGKKMPSGRNVDLKEPVLDNPGLKDANDAEDYPGGDLESVEGKEGLLDTQGGDDGEDPGEMVIRPDLVGLQNAHKPIEYIVPPNESSQRQDVYPNTDGFSEDDDHFFPFFLTAIILVVLLYVLYHNKNKVMGLILEGRQTGRRRNSRGHAYRRLDTLEQAMSGNAGIPPSKIIY